MKKTIITLGFVFSSIAVVQAQVANTVQGTSAGASISSADSCTFIGYEAGYSNSFQSFLTGIGASALRNGTTSLGYSTALGYRAGRGSDITAPTGDYGIYIGHEAGKDFTSGNDNVFIGYRSGYANTTGSDNVFIGKETGFDHVSGFDNVFIGMRAGYNSIGSDDNVFIGNEAGYNTTEGNRNVFIGDQTGYSNTTGTDNTAVGRTAMRALTTGTNNTALGNEAGYDCSIGTRNVFIGDSTGIDNNAGSRNTFVGQGAGSRNEHAWYNTFVGWYAGIRTNVSNGTTNASRNTFLGAIAGDRNEEGSDNLAFGYDADFSADGTNESIVFGNYARGGSGTTDRVGLIAIGHNSLAGQNYSIALGHSANVNTNNAIGIGYNTNVSAANAFALGTATDVNYSYAGALGSNAVADTTNALVIGGVTSTDRMSVGVGTTKPNQKASLDLAETDHGFMISRMTTAEETAFQATLGTAEEAMMIFNTDEDKLKAWDGTQWVTTGIQDLDLVGNTLSLTDDASTVDLSPYLDNTDNQTLDLTGNMLTISSGNAVDLSAYLDNTDTQLTETEVDAFVANNGYLTSFTEVDGDITNEIQDISLVGTDLSISSGSTIDLSSIDTDTDDQTLSLAGTTLTIVDGNSVDLTSIDTDTQLNEAQVDAYVANNGYLTSFTEVDGDPTNEIQDISLTGSDLAISSGSTIDLSSIDTDTDNQTLSLVGTTLSIADGNAVDLSSIDTDTDTDEQDLTSATLTGTVLTVDIENGASVSVDLTPLLADLQNQINQLDIRVTELEACACDSTAGLWENGLLDTETPILYQNIPNPFNNSSSIKYYIPSYAQSANLVISNSSGQIISNIKLPEVGAYGETYVNADGLTNGAYYYTLYVNQTKIDTKTMVVE